MDERLENWRASFVAHLATLTLLIDQKILTHEQVAQRLERFLDLMPGEREGLEARVGELIDYFQTPTNSSSKAWSPVVIRGGLDDPQHDS